MGFSIKQHYSHTCKTQKFAIPLKPKYSPPLKSCRRCTYNVAPVACAHCRFCSTAGLWESTQTGAGTCYCHSVSSYIEWHHWHVVGHSLYPEASPGLASPGSRMLGPPRRVHNKPWNRTERLGPRGMRTVRRSLKSWPRLWRILRLGKHSRNQHVAFWGCCKRDLYGDTSI